MLSSQRYMFVNVEKLFILGILGKKCLQIFKGLELNILDRFPACSYHIYF